MKSLTPTRRQFLGGALLVVSSVFLASCGQQEAPSASGNGTASTGSKVVVGFSQIGAESGWRSANTKSIKEEAAKRGVELQFSDAQQKQENQIKAIRSFAAQGVDVIAFSPVVETGWEPVLREVKKANIPVILMDRSIDISDPSLFTTFIGPDSVEEGRRAGRFLVKATGGKAMIAELQGTPGSAPAIDRKKGFEEIISKEPGMKIIKSQSGDFTRAKGKEVMESFLKSPDGNKITAVFSHNDDMGLGAIQALEEAGKKPGTQITTVSIDGVKDAFQAMVDGKLNCTVECNPMLGPPLFDAVADLQAGKTLPRNIATKEGVFTQKTAKEDIKTRQY